MGEGNLFTPLALLERLIRLKQDREAARQILELRKRAKTMEFTRQN